MPGLRAATLLLGRGLALLSLGAGTGILVSVYATSLGFAELLSVPGPDLPAWLPNLAALFAVGLLACYLPVRRHVHVDPISVLRAE